MARFFLIILLLPLSALLLSSCKNTSEEVRKPLSNKDLQESLIDANKRVVQTEDQQIKDFLNRYKWNVNETGSGLKYLIYEKGSGEKVTSGRIVTLDFSVSLLNGTQIYNSQDNGFKEFQVGRGGVETGLEEGILLLHQGDRAKFILPSHLAFGLVGDRDKIPPKTTIIYDIKLLKIR